MTYKTVHTLITSIVITRYQHVFLVNNLTAMMTPSSDYLINQLLFVERVKVTKCESMPQGNIHELSTFRGSIQTQCGYVTPSTFRRGRVRVKFPWEADLYWAYKVECFGFQFSITSLGERLPLPPKHTPQKVLRLYFSKYLSPLPLGTPPPQYSPPPGWNPPGNPATVPLTGTRTMGHAWDKKQQETTLLRTLPLRLGQETTSGKLTCLA